MATYAKGIVAVLSAVLVTLSTMVAPDTTWGRVIAVASALVGAVAVIMVPNRPKPPADSSL